MKFIVSSLKLLKNLQALSGVIGSKNTLPILDDFLFQLTENELKITTSDLDVTMAVSMVPDMVEGIGEVMAASIIAKVERDRIMVAYDKDYPQYGYAKHKGYPTPAHKQICRELGPSPIQRLTFRY